MDRPTPAEMSELRKPPLPGQPNRVGVGRTVGRRFDVGSANPNNGAAETIDRNGSVQVSSTGVSGIRLHLDNCHLPDSQIYLYSSTSDNIFGPYVCEGGEGVHTHTVFGDDVTLQLVNTNDAESSGTFEISEVFLLASKESLQQDDHGDDRSLQSRQKLCNNVGCIYGAGSPSEPCIEGLPESATNPNLIPDALRYAVGYMLWPCSGGQNPFMCGCTGTLINDSQNSGTPYFMTANHCLSSKKWAGGLEVLFEYWIEGCGDGTCDNWTLVRANHPQSKRTLGSELLVTGRGGDFTLVKLNGPLPANSTFLGWDTNVDGNSVGLYTNTVSHPKVSALYCACQIHAIIDFI